MRWIVSTVCVLVVLTNVGPATLAAEIRVQSTAELRTAATTAKPGTRIVMAPGVYAPCFLEGVHGSPDAMIEILAADPNDPPVFRGGNAAFFLRDGSYVTVMGLIAERAAGNNFQSDNGTHHVVLANCVSRDIAAEGNNDGIKLSGLTDFLVYRCRVERWGHGGSAIDMVGCARGLVTDCDFAYPDLVGHGANGVQAKGGSFAIGIHRSRFNNAGSRAIQLGGSTGKQWFFQGNLDKGWEAYDLVAMGNVIVGGYSSVSFVTSTDCTFTYNTIVRPDRYIARILREGDLNETAEGTFSHNLVIHDGKSINIGPDTKAESFRFEGNYWTGDAPSLPATVSDGLAGPVPELDANHRPVDGSPAAVHGAFAPDMDEAWREHTPGFRWAWDTAELMRKQEPESDRG